MSIDKKIAFLGGGNMAEALIRGMLSGGVARPDTVIVTDVSGDRLEHLRRRYGIISQKSNIDAVKSAEIIVLSVKPQVIDGVLQEIAPALDSSKLVISIAAGVSMERIRKFLTAGPRIIRVMPNTPALVLSGATGIAAGKDAKPSDRIIAQELFGAVGRVVVVDEKLMDAVTGLSGSGPAYVFTFIESLADAGVNVGIPRALSMELAIQTVLGSARMALETKEHPAKLRDMVTSPGGTTIAGMHELEKGKFRAVIMSAVEAATLRSAALGGKAPAERAKTKVKAKAKKAGAAKAKGRAAAKKKKK